MAEQTFDKKEPSREEKILNYELNAETTRTLGRTFLIPGLLSCIFGFASLASKDINESYREKNEEPPKISRELETPGYIHYPLFLGGLFASVYGVIAYDVAHDLDEERKKLSGEIDMKEVYDRK